MFGLTTFFSANIGTENSINLGKKVINKSSNFTGTMIPSNPNNFH